MAHPNRDRRGLLPKRRFARVRAKEHRRAPHRRHPRTSLMTRSKIAHAVRVRWMARCSCTVLLGTLFVAPSVRAEGAPNAAAARALFGEGRKLAAQGKYREACPKFEESLRLDPGMGTQFNLADCLEHTGRTATAWAQFLDVAAAARAAAQSERERVARERAAALEPKLSRLTIEVKAADP